MGAVQGRAPIFVVLYTCTHTNDICHSLAQPPCCSQAHLFQCVHSQNYTGYDPPQLSPVAPKSGMGETKENHISLYLPKQGRSAAAVQGAGGKGSHPPQLKRNPNPPNKQIKKYPKSKPTPHPTCSEVYTTLKFSILDLGQEVNILFWKN